MRKKEFFTLSNFVSFLRIFMVIPIVYYIHKQQNNTALIIIAIAMASDWLDGFLARKLNQVTEAGKVLDPLADKICIAGSLVALTLFQDFPLWVAVLIIARDAVIIFGALMMFGHSHIIPPSNKIGKITVFIISVFAIAFMMNIEWLKLPLTVIALGLLIISMISYARSFYANVTNNG